MADEIRNTEDVIDSRDVLARIEELRDLLAGPDDETIDATEGEELDELRALEALAEEAEPYSDDWAYGAPLIRDSYFEEYAEELARDCGMVPQDLAWPCTCIDWEEAANQLKQDYTSVSFDGVEYWVR